MLQDLLRNVASAAGADADVGGAHSTGRARQGIVALGVALCRAAVIPERQT
jgi:hypothetical protein